MTDPKPIIKTHLVMFSGGVGSWAAAKRVVAKHGASRVVLLFADTLIEDEDLYRFLEDAEKNIGVPITRIAEGRTPWEVFKDEGLLGPSRYDPCSRILKRDLLDKWRKENCSPRSTITYFGIDWSEIHRLYRVRERNKNWVCEAPMCEKPCLSKAGMLAWLKEEGIRPPRLYELGFPHNNCGGFCVKAGIAHFQHLLKVLPDRYAEHEQQEREYRKRTGKPYTILRMQRNGKKYRLTLENLRKRVERTGEFKRQEWGGCGCALGGDEE